jgi:hypothetical protein
MIELFNALEMTVGKEALVGAFEAYSGGGGAAPSMPMIPAVPLAVPGAPVKVRKPQSEETKAAAAAKRAATKARKAAEAAGTAVPVVADDDATDTDAPVAPAASVVPVPPAAEKPKKVISEEQKAKMKAGREAAKARKAAAESAAVPAAEPAAESAAVPAAEPAMPETDGNASVSSSQKRRGPKKLSEMTPEELAAHKKKIAQRKTQKAAAVPLPVSPPTVPAEGEAVTIFAPFVHNGTTYLRNKRGDLLSQEYEWVGRYDLATKIIDTDFKKPADLEEE